MAVERLSVRIRQDDVLLDEYFSKIKKSDRPYEVRRLLEKAIRIERKEKEMFDKIIKEQHQDAY